MRFSKHFCLSMALLLCLETSPCPADEPGRTGVKRQVEQSVGESVGIRQTIQKQTEQWREEKKALTARYERLEQERAQLEAKENELSKKNTALRQRITGKQKQLQDSARIQAEIAPLIDAQVAELDRHLETDLPFLPEERRQRIDRLEALRLDPDVAVSEKFRKLMEALLVEAEYGNTIEVYQQTVSVADKELLVNVFRLGRIGLFFQTLDGKTSGIFNVAASEWQPLSLSTNRVIRAAIDIGSKRQPVEMLTLPLGRMRVQ